MLMMMMMMMMMMMFFVGGGGGVVAVDVDVGVVVVGCGGVVCWCCYVAMLS